MIKYHNIYVLATLKFNADIQKHILNIYYFQVLNNPWIWWYDTNIFQETPDR